MTPDLPPTRSGLPPTADPGATADVPPADADADADATTSAGPVPRADGRPAVPGYEVLGELGRGGMGVVYQARQLALNRVVALKLLPDGSAARLVRFRQEAEAVARLQHPNIVQVFEVGVAAGGSFLALEYVDGGTLQQKTAGVPQPSAEAARLVEVVARAVHHAHERRIVHRDLKPANVLLTAGGVPKVADFGLARFLDVGAGVTATADFLGTPAYAAPEQVQNRAAAIGPATDVYGLGAILYELLTGCRPFDAGSVPEILRAVVDRDPVPPRRLRPDCPRNLETVCLKCLQKDPGRRYASAADLADDLHRFLAGEPIRARPVGAGERVVRWVRRNPAVAGLLLAVGALLLAAAVGGAVMSVRLSAALREAEGNAEQAGREREAAERERDAAQAAQREARERLCESSVAEAQAKRFSGRPGQRVEALAAVRRAVELARELGKPTEEFDGLRTLAIAALALPDVRVVRDIPRPADAEAVELDAESMGRYAVVHAGGGVSVHRLADDAAVARLPAGPGAKVRFVLFDSGGQSLVVQDVATGVLKRWTYAGGPLTDLTRAAGPVRRAEVTPDGRRALVLADDPKQTAVVYDLPAFRPVREFVGGAGDQDAALDPTGRQVARWLGPYRSAERTRVLVDDVDTGKRVAELDHPDDVQGCAWHPDGRTLYVGTINFNEVHAWDAPRGQRLFVLRDQRGGAPHLGVNRGGDLLAATSGWANGLQVWHPHTGKPILRMTGASVLLTRASADGRLVGTVATADRVRVWAAEPSPVFRTLAPDPAAGGAADVRLVAAHPGGRLVAVDVGDRLVLADAATGRELARLPAEAGTTAAFEPAAGHLWTRGPKFGLLRWPVRPDPAAPGRVTVGPPEPVAGPRPAGDFVIGVSRDGRVVATPTLFRVHVSRADGSWPPLVLGPLDDVRSAAVSPDGRWVATTTFGAADHPGRADRGVHVWDAATGRLIRHLTTTDGGGVVFSPDGRWLYASSTPRVWRSDDWAEAGTLPVGTPYRGVAFSPDGGVLAAERGDGAVVLQGVPGGRILAVLENPLQARANTIAYSADGGRLVVAARDALVAQVWDVRALRRELLALGLDWEAPLLPPPTDGGGSTPLTVAVLGDELLTNPRKLVQHAHEAAVGRCWTHPLDPAPRVWLGEENLGGRRPAVALLHLNLALTFDPGHVAARFFRARANLQLKRYEAALADASAVLLRIPGYADARAIRDEAEAALRAAEALPPEAPPPRAK